MPYNWGGFFGPLGGFYTPPQRAEMEAGYAAFIQGMQAGAAAAHVLPEELPEKEEGDMVNKFRVGCDPEFMLLSEVGVTIKASDYFQHAGEIGYDHNGRVGEFRPGPSKGILPIVKKIQALVKSNLVQGLGCKLRAGAVCNGDSLGGHVHLDMNPFKPEIAILDGMQANNERLTLAGQNVVKALDALTKTLEYLDILPANESAARRKNGQGYGRFGDVRNCKGHMEYRSMASWLYDPRVAFLCLTAAKLAAADPEGAYEALKNCDSFAKFAHWLEGYVPKDINARRASEKLLDNGLKALQVDPSVDFKSRWNKLGL